MEDNFYSYGNDIHICNKCNTRNCICYSNNPFFSESPKERKKKIEIHHSSLMEVYKRWYNYQLPIIDLDTFNPQFLKLSQLGQEEILKDYALSHLKYYENAFKKYECISKLYDKFNIQVKEFQDENREHLRKILGLGTGNNYNLNQLMRLYLYMIISHYKNNESIDRIPVIEYGDDENPVFSGLSLRNAFRSKENEIIQDLKTRKDELINKIDNLVAVKELLETEVAELKDLLKPIIVNDGLDIKGKCNFEKQLSLIGIIKSYLHFSH